MMTTTAVRQQARLRQVMMMTAMLLLPQAMAIRPQDRLPQVMMAVLRLRQETMALPHRQVMTVLLWQVQYQPAMMVVLRLRQETMALPLQ
jgi:hypothetical protein